MDESVEQLQMQDRAHHFLKSCGLAPTPDAIGQLLEVFVPCLSIMCDRPWDPNGATWKEAGRKGALADLRKKFKRVWYRYWTVGEPHEDSIFDLINYAGFTLRSTDPGWGEWGEPARVDDN